VNHRAIGAWEGGLSYPGAERLKQLIALYSERGTLPAGWEQEVATALWEALRAPARRPTVPCDPHWFAALQNPETQPPSPRRPHSPSSPRHCREPPTDRWRWPRGLAGGTTGRGRRTCR
jgi:hypothetical protein